MRPEQGRLLRWRASGRPEAPRHGTSTEVVQGEVPSVSYPRSHIQVHSTSVCKTSFTGLPPGATLEVEVCITDSAGTTAWSHVESILVK